MTGSVADSPMVLRRGRLSLKADSAEENAPVAALFEQILPEEGNQPARSADDPWFANAFQSSTTPAAIRPVVPEEPDDLWLSGADMEGASIIIFLHQLARPTNYIRIDWSRAVAGRGEPTRWELGVPFARFEEKVAEFVGQEGLQDAMVWLVTNAPRFFPGACFEIDVLDHEEGEDALLALKIHSEFITREFRERRHRICEAMLAAGFERLHQFISIFQRSEHICGRQIFSWYSSVSVD